MFANVGEHYFCRRRMKWEKQHVRPNAIHGVHAAHLAAVDDIVLVTVAFVVVVVAVVVVGLCVCVCVCVCVFVVWSCGRSVVSVQYCP